MGLFWFKGTFLAHMIQSNSYGQGQLSVDQFRKVLSNTSNDEIF